MKERKEDERSGVLRKAHPMAEGGGGKFPLQQWVWGVMIRKAYEIP
jgi:hypothetical protein